MRATIVASLFAAVVVALAGKARAQEFDLRETPEPPPPPRSSHAWEAGIGYRGGIVRDAGYDPFSKDDWASQASLFASRVMVRRGRFALAVGAAWDFGGSDATDRGQKTSLGVNRLTAPLQLRWSLGDTLYVFGKIAPGAERVSASLQDPSAPATLVAVSWVPCADASAGAAWSFAGIASTAWWVTAEGGYAWATRAPLSMAPDLPQDDPRRTGNVDLGSLAMTGAFGRVGIVVGF